MCFRNYPFNNENDSKPFKKIDEIKEDKNKVCNISNIKKTEEINENYISPKDTNKDSILSNSTSSSFKAL